MDTVGNQRKSLGPPWVHSSHRKWPPASPAHCHGFNQSSCSCIGSLTLLGFPPPTRHRQRGRRISGAEREAGPSPETNLNRISASTLSCFQEKKETQSSFPLFCWQLRSFEVSAPSFLFLLVLLPKVSTPLCESCNRTTNTFRMTIIIIMLWHFGSCILHSAHFTSFPSEPQCIFYFFPNKAWLASYRNWE